MKLSDKYEKLMEFIYDEYSKSDTFQGHGEYANTIVEEFQHAKRIRFGDDVYAQIEAIRYLMKQGWIEAVSINGRSIIGSPYSSLIKPTRKGILYVEDKRNPGKIIMKTASNTAEIIGRFLKGFSGR